MARLIALIAALTLGAVIAWACERPPEPRSASVAANAFSAERAMVDVASVAREPHPVGSPQNAAVAAYLTRRMMDLGLEVTQRPGLGVQTPAWGGVVGGSVVNLVGVLPGRDRTAPAVALMAHYDSVPGSPGAADDAASVAAALEVVRAIRAQQRPARDLMVVITDGEEAGLLGANAFFRRDPLARRIGFVINMEARGSGGRVQMFQAGRENGGAIELFRRTAVRPAASSMFGFAYEQMPNDTDFTEARKAGVDGLNYAFIGSQFDYHSPTSTPSNLDRGTLQDLGDQVLSTARAAAFAADLPAKAPNVVYGHVFGDLLVAYPPAVGWLVLLAAAGLLALGLSRAHRVEPLHWSGIARGAGAGLYALLGGAAVLQFARLATGADVGFLEQRILLAQVSRWETTLFLLGLGFLLFAAAEVARGRRLAATVLPLAAGLACCALARDLDAVGLGAGAIAAILALVVFRRSTPRPAAWSGVLLLGLLLGLLAQALAPLAAFVIVWPLLLASAAAAATAMGAHRRYGALAALGAVAAVTMGWLGGLAHLTFLSLDIPALLALPLFLAGLVIWPLAQPSEGAPPSRRVGPALMLVGIVALIAVRYGPVWSAARPQVSFVQYNLDQDDGRAWLIAPLAGRTAWADAVLKADGGVTVRHRTWLYREAVNAAPARALPLSGANLDLASRPDSRLTLDAAAPAGARVLSLRLRPDTAMRLESVNGVGVDLPLKPGDWTSVRWEAGAPRLRLVLRPAGPGSLQVRHASTTESWPAGAVPLPNRPPELMPFDQSDSTVVTGTRRFAW